jgi:ABC-type sugar transport system substrate-binding protein
MKKIPLAVIVLLVTLLTVLLFTACNKSKTASEPAVVETVVPAADTPLAGKRIGVAQSTLYDDWNTGVHDEFIRIGKEYGVAEMNVQDGNGNAETQQRQVEDFISQKYDAIFIAPVGGSDGIKSTLDKANAAGIPVIAFDLTIDWPPLVSHIAWDHAETGRLSGRYVAEYAKKNLDGKVKVGILAMLDEPATAIRSTTFKEELEKSLGKENITYVFEQDFGRTREGAANIVTNNIAKPIDVIWGAVDNGAFGARVALQMAGAQGVKVVSSGAWGKESFQTIADNDPYYTMFIGVPPEGIVRKSLEAAAAYFSGDKNIPKDQNIDLAVIDAGNIADYRNFY